jgi:hypothetical protein
LADHLAQGFAAPALSNVGAATEQLPLDVALEQLLCYNIYIVKEKQMENILKLIFYFIVLCLACWVAYKVIIFILVAYLIVYAYAKGL